jgi:hypothetical protein
LQAGTCTTGDVAKLAADVLANPPALLAAAQRYLRSVGTEHEGAAAVAFLALLVGDSVSPSSGTRSCPAGSGDGMGAT